jgi:acyl carrier protein
VHSTSTNDVFDKVLQAVEQTVYIDGHTLTPATRITKDLKIGRFGRLKLALYLEETFDVELPDEAVERFETVGDIAQYVGRWSHETANVTLRTSISEPARLGA